MRLPKWQCRDEAAVLGRSQMVCQCQNGSQSNFRAKCQNDRSAKLAKLFFSTFRLQVSIHSVE
jgi:hypothetical protein